MKLPNVLLLFFLFGILFAGVVSDILADFDQQGPYEAGADAHRFGGVLNNRLHVHLWAHAYSSANGKNGHYSLKIALPNKDWKKEKISLIIHGGLIDGQFYDWLHKNHRFEENAGDAEATAGGVTVTEVDSQIIIKEFLAEANESVGPMPASVGPLPHHSDPSPAPVIEPEQQVGIFPIDPTDSPYPGERHGYKLITAVPYYYVSWYVKTPWDTSELGEYIEGDNGDGTATTATMSYTYPSGAMHTGDFLITAVIYRWSDMSQYEETYVATVTLE